MRRCGRVLVGAALGAVMLAGPPGAWAQDRDLEELMDESLQGEEELEQVPGEEVIPGLEEEPILGRIRLPTGAQIEELRIAQDRAIDPTTYIVGPGDVLQLYIWGEFDRSYVLKVDPEGQVLIPTVGAFPVTGRPLSEVRETIYGAARRKYSGVDVTLTLSSMRYFTVYVAGAVLREGSHMVHPTTRVTDLVERAGGYLDELRGRTIQEETAGQTVTRVRRVQNRPAGRRTLQLHHGDGTRETVDLDMFHATGDVKHNPYLRMGDILHVQFRQEEVYIYGEVNLGGTFEYRAADTLGDLVALAKGLRVDVPLQKVEVWRFREGTEEAERIVLGDNGTPGKRFAFADVASFPLQPKDMVLIRGRVGWRRAFSVRISGEVQFPGRYRIFAGETRLMDVIEEAGGFTERASLVGARVIRARQRRAADPELARLQRMQSVSGLADMSPEDRAYLKTKWREERGRVAVDFERLVAGDEEQNIALESGDVIHISERRRTVSISGQVYKPGLVDFEPGRTVRFYLEKAGGYAYRADRGGSRLIRARTGLREELSSDLAVEVGDEIWIPEKEYRDWWALTQGTMRTVAETLTLVVLARSF
ncbi:MAG: SLBB domain-containing protein [Candidatus Latescibacterota bacterium]